MNSETNEYINGDLDKLYYIILNINLLLDYWWWTYILNITNKYF
jgi:hypothetical protein